MGRIKDYLGTGSVIGLLIMIFALPFAACMLVWNFISPVTVWQMIVLFVINIFLYIFIFIAEIIIIGVSSQ